MNWAMRLVQITSILPYVIMGIQQIHTDAKGADKKTLAMESLGLATATAEAILPGQQVQIAAVSTAVSNTIDNIVAAMHAISAPGFGTNQVVTPPPAA